MVAPLVLSLCAILLLAVGHIHVLTGMTIGGWGLVFGVVPVGWSAWITCHLSDDAESAGGLQVAVIQVANIVGAALGGVLLDTFGTRAPFGASSLLLALSGALMLWNTEPYWGKVIASLRISAFR